MNNVVPLTNLIEVPYLPEHEISIPRLSSVLERAYLDPVIDEDGDILIENDVGFPVWLSWNPKAKIVTIFTYESQNEQSEYYWLRRVNHMNCRLVIPHFSYHDGSVWGSHSISCEGGISPRNLVRMVRRFSTLFADAITSTAGEELKFPVRR